MLAAVIGIVLIILFFIYEVYIAKKEEVSNPATFYTHVQEIRDMIHQCNSLSEWWTLDQEIDWLEQTWSGKIPERMMIEETGKLYEKWWKQRPLVDPRFKTA
jgi:hypothetical protein